MTKDGCNGELQVSLAVSCDNDKGKPILLLLLAQVIYCCYKKQTLQITQTDRSNGKKCLQVTSNGDNGEHSLLIFPYVIKYTMLIIYDIIKKTKH